MMPYDLEAVPYAALPKLSIGDVEICIGNRFSPYCLDKEHAKRISISAVQPKHTDADHLVQFEDGEGHEGADEIEIAKDKIAEGAHMLHNAVNRLQRSKKKDVRKVVIVHCYAGQNRSAAIVSAYAIKKRGWEPTKIKNYLRRQVKRQRNVTAVLQNKSFRDILQM
tara:strand:+ start:632 stop:1129 length:498 start_codon:yes stop_codon:yes gene_type:complete